MQESESHRTEKLRVPAEIRVMRPIGVDIFLAGSGQASNLSPHIEFNPELRQQVGQRRQLNSLLGSVFGRLEDVHVNLDNAVEENLIEPESVILLYDSLRRFLQEDENNARILLYLPFELFPNLNKSTSQSDQMKISAERFGDLIWESWIRLLHETESRANFVDGDILEPGLKDPERVSKAGHITPELLARNIISIKDISRLLEVITDKTILTSLAEGVLVANERGLIGSTDWDNLRLLISSKIGTLSRLSKEALDHNDPNSDRISPGRARWLRKVNQEKYDNQEADLLAARIIDGESLEEIVGQAKVGRATVLGIIKAGTRMLKVNPLQAREFSENAELAIRSIKNSDDPIIQDAILSGLNHWARLGIVDNDFLQRFGVKMVDLSLPSQFDEEELSQEFGNLIIAAQKIKEHPELSQAIYPAFLLFGSRTKGHANVDSDLDAAVFFKPGVEVGERDRILEILKNDVPELPKADTLLEFWTTLDEGKLRYTVPIENTRVFVGEDQVHFLMGGIWIGNNEELVKMRQEILESYLDLSRFGDGKEERKRLLLGLLELDALQYRIMHKGYKKLYPSERYEGTANSDLIDWDSDFWDPGYRRVATKLFVSKVFLPDLS